LDAPQQTPGASPRFPLWTFLAAALPLGLLVWRFNWVCDDAYISFRFARNFARGDGLVYNAARHVAQGAPTPEAVEGYSNLLWVLLASVFERLGWEVTVPIRWVSAASAFALLAAVLAFARRGLGLSAPATFAVALLLGTFPPLGLWATSGMETMPFALALFLVFERLVGRPDRPRWLQATLAGLVAVSLRPDGILLVGLALAAALLVALSRGDGRARRAVLWTGAVVLAGVAIHVLWRLSYYGDWLPNTVRAKSVLSESTRRRGALYVGEYLLTFPGLSLALLSSLLLLGRPRNGLGAVLFLLATVPMSYAAMAGGDFMAMGRLLLPAVPFAFLLLGAALARLGLGWRGALSTAGVLALLSLLPAWDLHAVPEELRARCHFRWNSKVYRSEYQSWKGMHDRAWIWRSIGETVASYTEERASLVAGAIGALGYYSDRFIHDQNGLVTREVTRQPLTGMKRSPGHDRFVRRDFFKDLHPTYCMVNLWNLETTEYLIPERWWLGSPEKFPEQFWITNVLRHDTDPGIVRSIGSKPGNSVVLLEEGDQSLREGHGLRLVSWR